MAKDEKIENPEMEKGEVKEVVEPKLVVSNKDATTYDVFITNALYSHAHGMLDYRTAFLKSIDLVRSMIKAEE